MSCSRSVPAVAPTPEGATSPDGTRPTGLLHETFPRARPVLDGRNRAFWTGGSAGHLLVAQCEQCGFRIHPPRPICPRCHGREVTPRPVSGHGVVHSFTVSHYQWVPGLTPPYVVARVELEEQAGLVVLTNLIEVDPGEVTIGMPVTVRFAVNGRHHIPVFRPHPSA